MKHIALAVAAIAAVLGLLMLGGATGPDDGGKPSAAALTGFLFKSASGDGKTLKYIEYVPRNLDLSRPAPLVVFLHGSGECGEDGQKQLAIGIGTDLIWHAERWPCIVLIPQKPVQ